jgi:hypothetical protein
MEYRQEDSIVVRQRGQVGLWSQFLLASLSEVHTLFWSMSHTKNLHWGGARLPNRSKLWVFNPPNELGLVGR